MGPIPGTPGIPVAQDLLHEAPEGLRLVRERPHLWSARAGEEPCSGDRILMHVKRDVCGMLVHGRLLRMRLWPLSDGMANPRYTTQAAGHSIVTITF